MGVILLSRFANIPIFPILLPQNRHTDRPSLKNHRVIPHILYQHTSTSIIIMCKSSRSFNKALTREASITIINPSSNAMLEEVDLEGGKTTAPVLPPIHIPLLSSWGEIVRRLLFVACIIAGVAYVVLRWYSAITSKAWLGLPIVISETLCVLWGLMEMYVTWRPVKRAGRDLRVVMPDR